MATSSDNLPLADVFRAAGELVAEGLIEDWALGGALAAIYYVEPFTTYDADIFLFPRIKVCPPDSRHLRAFANPRLASRARTSFAPGISRPVSRRW